MRLIYKNSELFHEDDLSTSINVTEKLFRPQPKPVVFDLFVNESDNDCLALTTNLLRTIRDVYPIGVSNAAAIKIVITFASCGGRNIDLEALYHMCRALQALLGSRVKIEVTNHILVSATVIFLEHATDLLELKMHAPYCRIDDTRTTRGLLNDHLFFIRKYLPDEVQDLLLSEYDKMIKDSIDKRGELTAYHWHLCYMDDIHRSKL